MCNLQQPPITNNNDNIDCTLNNIKTLTAGSCLTNAQAKAVHAAAELLLTLDARKQRLKAAGWVMLPDPPFVGNERLWQHPTWRVQLESVAVYLLED